MNHTKGLHHIGFAAQHFEETLHLYTQGFGMTIKHTWGHGEPIHMLDMGNGACIELFHQTPSACQTPCWQHITLKTADIRTAFQRAVRAGARVEREPTFAEIPEAQPQPVKMWFANLRGYEGEEIELIQEVEG